MSLPSGVLESSPRNDTAEGEVQHQTSGGQRTATSISETAPGLRAAVQSASVKFNSGLARLPRWAKGVIGIVSVLLLLYFISLPFRADERPVPAVPNPGPPATAASVPPSPAKAPFTSVQAKAHQQAWAKHLDTEVETTNSIGMKMLLIPPGEFTMGSPDSDSDANEIEKPQHLVKITKPYYLSAFEVTQQQYEKVMGTRPWQGMVNVKDGPDYPATFVSWNEAVEFCRQLSKQEGEEYRLPTEAEWEYACRAGTTTIYSFGDDTSKLGEHAWYDKNAWNVDEKYAHGVGQKLPNRWGLFDMHGNVWEWCQDRYAGFGSNNVLSDRLVSAQGKRRVGRGGSFNTVVQNARSANRNAVGPADPADPWSEFLIVSSYGGGFRVARTYGGAHADPKSREAAEWVLQSGGTLKLVGQTVRIEALRQLPEGQFGIELIDLNDLNGAKVDNEGLQNLAELTNLTCLGLHSTRVSDKGIDHLTKLDTLMELELSYTRITDKGLAKLTSLRRLQKLFLYGTSVTDEGVDRLTANLPNCRVYRD